MRRSAGFTLVEIMVALGIGGAVVLAAARLFGEVVDHARRLAETRQALDRDANGRRMLVAMVGSIDLTSQGTTEFRGEPSRVRFSSWSSGTYGWPRLTHTGIVVAAGGLVLGTGFDTLVVVPGVDSVAMDYLLEAGARESWVRRWQSPTTPPLAIRVRMYRPALVDTLLLVTGRRG